MDRYYLDKNAAAGGEHKVHTSGCKYIPSAADRLDLGDFPSREPALSAAQVHYPNSTGCVYCTLDSRFYQAALDGLIRFRLRELTRRFLVAHGRPVRGNLKQMWSDLEVWIQGSRSRCTALLEYVDSLRMWGRQRVFLFEVEEEIMKQLAKPGFIHDLEGGAYEQPAYIWSAEEPLLVHVKREGDLLIFKLVEMRKFDRLVDNVMAPFEERSTNFLIVNLRHHYAELRLQALRTRARRNMQAERDLLLKELRKHVDLGGFSPIRLGKVMAAMIRKDIYPIDSITFKSGRPSKSPVLLAFTQLFKHPIPREVNAHWNCNQDVLGEQPLYFTLNGRSDYVEFGGIADPDRVNDILERIVIISRVEPVGEQGLVNKPLAKLEDKPVAKAFVLSAGAIAAAILAIPIDEGWNYFFDWALGSALHVPSVVLTAVMEIAGLWRYYGWRRIEASFRALYRSGWRAAWREITAARERRTIRPEPGSGPEATELDEGGATLGYERGQRGSSTVKVEPRPGADSTETRPSIRSTSSRQT